MILETSVRAEWRDRESANKPLLQRRITYLCAVCCLVAPCLFGPAQRAVIGISEEAAAAAAVSSDTRALHLLITSNYLRLT